MMLLLFLAAGFLAVTLHSPADPRGSPRRPPWAEVVVEPPPGPLPSLLEEGEPLFG